MLPVLNIGPIAIQTSGLIVMIGIWFSIAIIEKYSRIFIFDERNFLKILNLSLVSILIFARISYIIQYPNDFLSTPLSIISLNKALFDFNSGIIFSSILFRVLIFKYDFKIVSALNALTPGISLFLIFYSLSLFANGDYFGIPSSIPWGIGLWGIYRHPLQLYFMVGTSVIFIFIIWQISRNITNDLFLKFLIFISSLVIFLEYFRGDRTFQLHNIHILQVLAFITLIISLYIINFQSAKIDLKD